MASHHPHSYGGDQSLATANDTQQVASMDSGACREAIAGAFSSPAAAAAATRNTPQQSPGIRLGRFPVCGRLLLSRTPQSPLFPSGGGAFPVASSVAGAGASSFVDCGDAGPLSNNSFGAGGGMAEGCSRVLSAALGRSFPSGGIGGSSYTDAVRLEQLRNNDANDGNPINGCVSNAPSLATSEVDPAWAAACQAAQPFGTYLGTALGLVPAYSNGAVEDISHGASLLPGTDIYCGMPWECLEYARRFLIAYFGITFASMDGACSLFECDHFMYLENFEKCCAAAARRKAAAEEEEAEVEAKQKQKENPLQKEGAFGKEERERETEGHESLADIPSTSFCLLARDEWTAPPVAVRRVANGEATAPPPVGALLLYPIVYPAADMPFGHVTVVVESSAHHIRVAEQNWDNSLWAHRRYSREIPLATDAATGRISVTDEPPYAVLGWLDFSANEPRPPTDWDRSYANDATRCGPSVPIDVDDEEDKAGAKATGDTSSAVMAANGGDCFGSGECAVCTHAET